jgi:Serine endopeptidase inhibitors
VKDSSIKFSLTTLTVLGLAAVAAAPASASIAPQSTPTHTQHNETTGQDLPFFARFLEGQKPETTKLPVTLAGGGVSIEPSRVDGSKVQTRKYPSDSEDNTGGGIVTTQKYPSDSEDNTGGGIVTTKKYPSDSEDSTGGGIVTTKKYPSDSEDGGIVFPRRQR